MGVTPHSEDREPIIPEPAPSRARLQSRWPLRLWLITIASGAAASGLLRAGQINGTAVKTSLIGHEVVGAAIGVIAIRRLLARRDVWRVWLIGIVVACGWMTARTFAPVWAAVHAIVAAFAAAAIVEQIQVRTTGVAAWQRISAQLAFGVMLVQIAIGGLLRHQLIALPWHLLFAGAAALLVLVAAVPTVQASASRAAEKRIARSAITTILVQVSLGATMFVLILIETENVPVWLGLTVAHVVMGSVTLVAVLALARAHRATSDAA